MAQKQTLCIKNLDEIFSLICGFSQEAKPEDYCKSDAPEKAMQRDFAEYMSQRYTVLREITVPGAALNESELYEAKKGDWLIDESLTVLTSLKTTSYIAGELKFHGKTMTDRPFTEEVAERDLGRMLNVAKRYYDVTMTFVFFLTSDEQEMNAVYEKCEPLKDIEIKEVRKIEKNEKGYCGVAIQIIPRNSKADYSYNVKWNERHANVIKDKTDKDNYFPCVRRW